MFSEPRKLISTNVCSRRIRDIGRLLLYGSCIADEHADILEQLSENRVPLSVCMEEEHYNMVGFKLLSIMARVRLEEIAVLTVDGSPHCVQLHMLVEDCAKMLGLNKLNIRHFVVYKGKLIEISGREVKVSRYLSKVKRLMSGESNIE